MPVDDIKKLVAALNQFEKDILGWDRVRSRILEELRVGEGRAQFELQELIDMRREMVAAMQSLELAMKNSAASFARFEQKAAKDEKTLAEAKKKGGGSGFDDKHPLLVSQREAFERVGHKLVIFQTEIVKLRDVLSHKYPKIRGMAELEKLATALRRDLDSLEDKSNIDQMAKQLDYAAEGHRLRG